MSLDIHFELDKCQTCGRSDQGPSLNITHNLGKMAVEAGVYSKVWRPDECGITKASQMIAPLQTAIATMKADPLRFEQYNAENGWGTYNDFVPWLERYLEMCKLYPTATISVSR